jgi:hypothetical protein
MGGRAAMGVRSSLQHDRSEEKRPCRRSICSICGHKWMAAVPEEAMAVQVPRVAWEQRRQICETRGLLGL